MNVELEENGNGGTFFVEKDGKKSAIMEFTIKGNTMDITHTEVKENLQGEGIGRKLVAAGQEYANRKKLDLEASCSYANKVLNG